MPIKIIASFDDGNKEDLRLAELMEKYGIKEVIFYIPSDWRFVNEFERREPLDESDVIELDKKFKVGSHSISHRLLTRIPIEEAKIEISESKDQLEYLLGHEIDSFCFPRGYANDQLREIVRKYYKHARNTLVGALEAPEDPIWESTTVHAGGKRRKEYEGTTWLKEAYKLLDEAIERGHKEDIIYSIFGHSWELTREKGWEDLEKLLKSLNEITDS